MFYFTSLCVSYSYETWYLRGCTLLHLFAKGGHEKGQKITTSCNVALNMAFLWITRKCNSHVRSLMKRRRQKVFFPIVMQQKGKAVHLQWHHNQQQIFTRHQEKFFHITQSTQFSLVYSSLRSRDTKEGRQLQTCSGGTYLVLHTLKLK